MRPTRLPMPPNSGRRSRMTLGEQLTDYVHAAFSGLWIQTPEAEEAEREITRHAAERGWKLGEKNVVLAPVASQRHVAPMRTTRVLTISAGPMPTDFSNPWFVAP